MPNPFASRHHGMRETPVQKIMSNIRAHRGGFMTCSDDERTRAERSCGKTRCPAIQRPVRIQHVNLMLPQPPSERTDEGQKVSLLHGDREHGHAGSLCLERQLTVGLDGQIHTMAAGLHPNTFMQHPVFLSPPA